MVDKIFGKILRLVFAANKRSELCFNINTHDVKTWRCGFDFNAVARALFDDFRLTEFEIGWLWLNNAIASLADLGQGRL